MMSRFILSFLSIGTLAFAAPAAPAKPSAAPVKKAEAFKPFTGKLLASKVRIRAKADLESPIIRQMSKNELLLVVA